MMRWWCLAALAVIALTPEAMISQSNDEANSYLGRYCSNFNVPREADFLSNLNATFSSLRRQVSSEDRVYYAVAQSLRNSITLYGAFQCRDYLSTPECLACFDASVSSLRTCGTDNGGRVYFDSCNLRYENNNFYREANVALGIEICGNQTLAQATEFRQTVEVLFSDLRTATPRTPDLYAASTRKVSGTNTTVYAVAQCNGNVSRVVCGECMIKVYRNVENCLPNTYGRSFDPGCFLRYSDLPYFLANQTTDLAQFLGRSRNRGAIIGGVVGGVGFLILLVVVLILWHHRHGSKKPSTGKLYGVTELQSPMTYSYNDLKVATNNFGENHKLGEGEFGSVYKAVLKNGEAVAVKRITISSNRGQKNFKSEVKIISNVHHRNLIRLLGCCSKGPNSYLVLEYMENRSLDKFVYGEKRGSLNWKQRFDIIFGIARGLAYLHEQYHVTIIHRDIKGSNILLDSEFQPKIADFGLARLLAEDKTHLSSKFPGTLGYMAPEYAIHGQFSEKADTYSFGIVVLEIISGTSCNEFQNDSATQNLLDHAWNLYESGMHLKLIDETLSPSEYREEGVKNIIEIALITIDASG